jgi:hypothetical protein
MMKVANDQLNKIFEVIGTPSDDILEELLDEFLQFVQRLLADDSECHDVGRVVLAVEIKEDVARDRGESLEVSGAEVVGDVAGNTARIAELLG